MLGSLKMGSELGHLSLELGGGAAGRPPPASATGLFPVAFAPWASWLGQPTNGAFAFALTFGQSCFPACSSLLTERGPSRGWHRLPAAGGLAGAACVAKGSMPRTDDQSALSGASAAGPRGLLHRRRQQRRGHCMRGREHRKARPLGDGLVGLKDPVPYRGGQRSDKPAVSRKGHSGKKATSSQSGLPT